jgi:proprotein convertase subtilisin/kexin type 5
VANISCITCAVGYGLFNGTCHSPCPNRYYLSGVLCLPCSLSCLACNSSNVTCSLCVTSGANKAYFFNQTCVKTCPSNYYPIGGGANSTECIQCDSPCMNCNTTGTNCTSCPSGLYLFNSTCVGTCPTGYFYSNSTNKCEDFTV